MNRRRGDNWREDIRQDARRSITGWPAALLVLAALLITFAICVGADWAWQAMEGWINGA